MYAFLRRASITTAVTGLSICLLSACGKEDMILRDTNGRPIPTSTTRIAEVNIVNPGRDYSNICSTPDPNDSRRGGPNRIVVTDVSLLDALCALGLSDKVVAVTANPGSTPSYLGTRLCNAPSIRADPTSDAIAKASADLVLTTPTTKKSARNFDSARSVMIDSKGWEDTLTSVGAAVGRAESAKQKMASFRAEAANLGTRMDAAHSQVSLVRFGSDVETIPGTESFAGKILAMVGVQRPPHQRQPGPLKINPANFTAADGDLIYVSFEPGGLEHGKSVLLSDRWLTMGAPTWKRVLIINDEIWFRNPGLTAASLILEDLKNSLHGSSAKY